jgi:hypothetical protein
MWGMKAISLRARGGPEAFAYEEARQSRPGKGEVLVRVHAARVIHTELSWIPTWTTRGGEPPYAFILRALIKCQGETLGLNLHEALDVLRVLDDAKRLFPTQLPAYDKGTFPPGQTD